MTNHAIVSRRKRNRWTLVVLLLVIALAAATPVVVRLSIKRTPRLDRTARELLPPAAGRGSVVVVYGETGPLTQAILAALPRMEEAIYEVFPELTLVVSAAPDLDFGSGYFVQGVLLTDPQQYAQICVQVFGSADPGAAGHGGVGRAGFFLYCPVQEETKSLDAASRPISSRDIANVAHLLAQSLLELHLGERYRYLPAWYRHLVGEMLAVAAVPEVAAEARETYAQLRQSGGREGGRAERTALSDKAFRAGLELGGDHDDLAWAMATLIAQYLLASSRTSDFIGLVRDGQEIETAFRATAIGAITSGDYAADPTAASPVPIGTSLDAILNRIDQDMQQHIKPDDDDEANQEG